MYLKVDTDLNLSWLLIEISLDETGIVAIVYLLLLSFTSTYNYILSIPTLIYMYKGWAPKGLVCDLNKLFYYYYSSKKT